MKHQRSRMRLLMQCDLERVALSRFLVSKPGNRSDKNENADEQVANPRLALLLRRTAEGEAAGTVSARERSRRAGVS